MGFCGDLRGCGKFEKPPLAVFEKGILLATKNRQWRVLGGSKFICNQKTPLAVFASKKCHWRFLTLKKCRWRFLETSSIYNLVHARCNSAQVFATNQRKKSGEWSRESNLE